MILLYKVTFTAKNEMPDYVHYKIVDNKEFITRIYSFMMFASSSCNEF